MGRQRLAAGPLALGLRGFWQMRPHFRRLSFCGQAGLAGGDVGITGFVEEIATAREDFTLCTEIDPAQIGEFQSEFLDLGVAPVDFRGADAGLLDQAADPLLRPGQELWRGVKGGKFDREIHAPFYHSAEPKSRPVNK